MIRACDLHGLLEKSEFWGVSIQTEALLMENRIGSSNEAEIPKKSRSLDLKSLYQSEGSKEAQTKNLKRKVGIDVSVVEKKHERKKSRQAVSISGFRKVNGNGSKSLEEVYNGSLSSGSHDSKDSKSGLNQRLNHSSGFSSISETLEGSFTRIPRRKRGFVGRRKVENVSQVSKSAGLSSGEVGNVDQVGKLTGKDTGKQVKTLKVKQKKGSDEFKENGNGEKNSGKHFEEEAECPGHLAVNGGDLSINKSHTGQFVENNGDSSSKKSLRKRNRKRKGLVPDGKSVAKDGRPSTSTTGKRSLMICKMRMRRTLKRMQQGCYHHDLTLAEFTAHGSNYVSGSESASVDTAGRVLRPRKQHREKGSSRKRRIIMKFYWGLGCILVKKLHHIKYDDRDEEWINLQDERFKLLLLPSEVPGKPQRKRSVAREKRSNGENGKLKPNKEKKRDLTTEDDNYMGNYMDSEPIISWLARSSQRVKSSPFRASKKQKISGLSLTSVLPSLTGDGVSRHESLDGGLRNKDISNLSGNSVLPDRLVLVEGLSCLPQKTPFPKANKLPVVYYRRRFRNPCSVSRHSFEVNHVSTSLPESDTSHGHVGVASGPLKS
ncbi:hypothetical protein GH714_032910 [Hevea brasiliensis]|uniref:Tudor domain-containing protein n=1 Tax=Hevea brasiliensis TaxID=3981 RepID=A0A6A6LU65_HEVBR|nr:hypothetical protein GH714_032910 [Hevea brasiliensis]